MDKEEILKKVIESLDTWHFDEVRGNKVYFADAVKEALEDVIDLTQEQAEKEKQEQVEKVKNIRIDYICQKVGKRDFTWMEALEEYREKVNQIFREKQNENKTTNFK